MGTQHLKDAGTRRCLIYTDLNVRGHRESDVRQGAGLVNYDL